MMPQLRVRAAGKPLRRAGFAFGAEPSILVVAALTLLQIGRLVGEPLLVVEIGDGETFSTFPDDDRGALIELGEAVAGLTREEVREQLLAGTLPVSDDIRDAMLAADVAGDAVASEHDANVVPGAHPTGGTAKPPAAAKPKSAKAPAGKRTAPKAAAPKVGASKPVGEVTPAPTPTPTPTEPVSNEGSGTTGEGDGQGTGGANA